MERRPPISSGNSKYSIKTAQSIPTTTTPTSITHSSTSNASTSSSHTVVCTSKTIEGIMVGILYGCICFYCGLLVGTASSPSSTTMTSIMNGEFTSSTNTFPKSNAKIESLVQLRVQEQMRQMRKENQDSSSSSFDNIHEMIGDDTTTRFPESIFDIAVGMSVVNRTEFAIRFHEMGVPLDDSTKNNDQVLILYQTLEAIPNDNMYIHDEIVSQTKIPYIDDIENAVMNCDQLHIILSDHSKKRKQCTAIMGQYEAFHIQKFMRLPSEEDAVTVQKRDPITGQQTFVKKNKKLDSAMPLRLVNRGAQFSGRKSTNPPKPEYTKQYWIDLVQYIQSLDTVVERLRPIVAQIAVQQTIVVLVCNFGQSELLLNFICNARRRQLDLSAVLVFATDMETYQLMQAINVTTFYDEINYGSMPKNAAYKYADATFAKMMMAKVFCVHMISHLGYNLLFQDVDVIWYRHPFEYFHSNTTTTNNTNNATTETDNDSTMFDVYFQDDGNHALYYAPYSANTGFYYARSNERTRHFFNNFLVQGDLVYSTRSHQVPLVALLQEHASMYGLKVKIFSRTENDFPGGHAFHRRKDYIHDVFVGTIQPYIFHMSWTINKSNKIKYYQQFGEWYVQPQCVQQEVSTILNITNSSSSTSSVVVSGGEDILSSQCCSATVLFACHYRDKPSIHPCRAAPPIDKGKPSWW